MSNYVRSFDLILFLSFKWSFYRRVEAQKCSKWQPRQAWPQSRNGMSIIRILIYKYNVWIKYVRVILSCAKLWCETSAKSCAFFASRCVRMPANICTQQNKSLQTHADTLFKQSSTCPRYILMRFVLLIQLWAWVIAIAKNVFGFEFILPP